MTHVKICGLKRVEDAAVAVEAGADLLGFVFAPSRRRMNPEEACDLIAELPTRSSVRLVGIFVDEAPAEVNRIARLCGLDYAQLSGDEPDHYVRALDVPVIKAIHVETGDPGSACDARGRLAERMAGSSAAILLLDTARLGARGGTGETFDWSRVPPLDRPILLAGGLNPGNVTRAIETLHPWGVDVSSGVETEGRKDPTKIRAFLRAAKGSRVG
jgi:phosphoribosylanthranilate isomerase